MSVSRMRGALRWKNPTDLVSSEGLLHDMALSFNRCLGDREIEEQRFQTEAPRSGLCDASDQFHHDAEQLIDIDSRQDLGSKKGTRAGSHGILDVMLKYSLNPAETLTVASEGIICILEGGQPPG